eukprot:TRINITY_DN7490_c0_g1_i1.p1 TRINITY_DN7490_c0_g1~~TRINITY_DN7490_c0_g1_i1.p1  ORF type:complete len:311 (-),score=142.78 TRINITY_DN7490_c0_g1_i1:100-981(-)
MQVEQLTNEASILGEGSLWWYEQQKLLWVDILAKKVHLFNPQNNQNLSFELPEFVGSVVCRKQGGLLVALQSGFAHFDIETQTIVHKNEIEPSLNRLNDGKCSPEGRFWAGSMRIDELFNPPNGKLWVLDHNWDCRKALDNISISNGLAWSLDHKTMYYIDSPTLKVSAFDYDSINGNISNRRTVIQYQFGQGFPDGMTIDNQGMLWIADWDGFSVSQWNPNNGSLLQTIKIDNAKDITSIAFGGNELQDLYITSSSKNGNIDGKNSKGGMLFRIPNIGSTGIKHFQFDDHRN